VRSCCDDCDFPYTSNTYTGSGSITRMRAGLCHTSCYSPYDYADNATFVSACYTGFLSLNYGLINQYESSGASHTIYGHMDNSPNHTGCHTVA